MVFDVAVIGAGIAGAVAAFALAPTHSVVILEREDQPGYHTTGRSAALFTEAYGNASIRSLLRASRAFLSAPPAGFSARPILSPRGVLMIAPHGGQAQVEAELARAEPGLVERIELDRAAAMVPILDRAYVGHALHEPGAADIDIAALHQGYLRAARALDRHDGSWRLATPAGTLRAGALVNAAGAWADQVAAMAGAAPIGLVPKRRTAILFDAPADCDTRAWPLVHEIGERGYFKPESGRLMASPADETPSPPCDAQPEEIDVARTIEWAETVTSLRVRRVVRRWAGLRSFVADRTLAIGPSRDAPGFFWLAGQGGYGIQTAPAAGALIAAMIRGEDPARAAHGVDVAALSPARLGA
jgi:D-arginine dehydrogenase